MIGVVLIVVGVVLVLWIVLVVGGSTVVGTGVCRVTLYVDVISDVEVGNEKEEPFAERTESPRTIDGVMWE